VDYARIWASQGGYEKLTEQGLEQGLEQGTLLFDLWTSGNNLSLNGVVAQFIDSDF
jgi:hypothetical protein